MPPPEPPGRPRARLLILGGTTEAAALATLLAADPRLETIIALAGRTAAHRPPPGRVRIGGFGGAAGLAAWLRAEGIALVVDATHPFAATISHHAAEACAAIGTPRRQLLRPAWQPEPGDRWITVPDMDAAAAALPGLGRRVFLTVGRQEMARFGRLPQLWFLVRMIDPPAAPLPLADYELLLARGPFAPADEIALLQRHRIDLLVSKNSGGAATYPKIAAARSLGIPVLMIDRPAAPAGAIAATVEAAAAWVDATLGAENACIGVPSP